METSNPNSDFIGLDEYNERLDIDLTKNSIIMLGLENVGKSSVVMKYFERNKSINDIKNIKPTIYQNIIHKQNLFFGINRSFRVFDLGGQEAYLTRHLEQKSLLLSALCQIWVVDSQGGLDKLQESITYFNKVVDILKTSPLEKRPKIFVLNHKHEEGTNNKISLEEVKNLFAEHVRFPIESYYETTIFDESIFEALSDIFYKLLAPEVIQQVFRHVDLHQLSKQAKKEGNNIDGFLRSQGRLWSLKIKESFSRQQMGLDPLPSPSTARALINNMQLYFVGGNYLLKVPKHQLPSEFTSKNLLVFLEGAIHASYIQGELKLINESDDYIECEISRKAT